MTEVVRVLVVDDSPTARALLVGILDGTDGIVVAGEAASGREAVAMTRRLRPSIVVMDIEMPDGDGFEATDEIMREVPTPIVIVTGRHDPQDIALTLQATTLGALAVLPKPAGPASPQFDRDAKRLVSLVRALSDVAVVRRRQPAGRQVQARRAPIRAVGVGASTGGPAAVYRFLSALGSVDVPVLLVQHISEGFSEGLVRWLRAATPMTVKLAEHGERLVGRTVYIAPDGRHLELSAGERVRLGTGPASSGFRPSVSNLFCALAAVYGAEAAAVVLTGMGEDGVAGAREVRGRGGIVLAQDEESSTVFGMPRAVATAGLADIVGAVEELALNVAAHVTMGER